MDFKTVKALSSPTRIRILNCILEKQRTPTEISNKVGKSKSTISSHLETLSESGLILKNKKEGRKRVLYEPTEKAENIVKGKEKKVTFTLTSSVISMLAGIGLLATSLGSMGLGSLQDDEVDEAFEVEEEVEEPEDDFTMTEPSEEPEEIPEADDGIDESTQLIDSLIDAPVGEYLLPGVGALLILIGLALSWQGYNYLKLKRIQ